jgi:hypothetical protein
MAIKRNDGRPRLSFEQANVICRSLVVVGDKALEHVAELRRRGFAAFVPRAKFVEAFAESSEELEIHRRYVVEQAKELLGRPWTIRIYDEDLERLYSSPFLQELRARRDQENGVPVGELRARYSPEEALWRREIDPCRRRMVQCEVHDRAGYQERWAAMLDEERSALQMEAERHSTGSGRLPHTLDVAGRYRFFSATMERNAAELGFQLNKGKSRPSDPVLTRPIADDWVLSWIIDDKQSFSAHPSHGFFAPTFGIRSDRVRGAGSRVESGESLTIRYSGIVPGFANGYWKFFDLDELETIIMAHLNLYGLIASAVEAAVSEVLAIRS